MPKQRTLSHIFLLLVILAPGGRLLAQMGQMTGRVEDASGAVVAGAHLILKNLETGVGKSGASNGEGYYTFPQLDPGLYAISVSMSGFKSMNRSGIKLDVAQTARVDFRLDVGDTTQEVTVSSTAPLLQSESAAVGQVIGHGQVVDLPLNGRDFTQLATLTPGATRADSGGIVQSSNIRVNGMRTSKTQFTIDGVSATDQRFDGVIIQPAPDAIQEFRVQSNSMSAEYGQGGSAITIQLKSGTNQLHGTVYEFMRNDVLDARNFFAIGKAPLRQNQFGAAAGGPIRKNRTFVFMDYQGTRIRRGQTFNVVVPSDANRAGDFTAQTAAVIDPLATPRAPFAGNRIPANRFAPQSVFFLKFFPSPNAPGGTLNRNASLVQNVDQADVRVDHVISNSDTVQTSYSVQENPTITPGAFPENGALTVLGRTQQIRLGETHTFGPSMFNEFRASYMRAGVHRIPQGLGTNYTVQSGISGFEVTSLESPGFPGMAITGYTGINGQVATPQTYRSNVYEFLDNWTRIAGRHTLKAGVLFRTFSDAATNGGTSRGNFSFTGQFSTNAVADYMLGIPFQAARSFPNNEFGGSFQNQNFFIQDDWKVTNRLTFNLGLRYELDSVPRHMHDAASLVDPDTRRIIISKITPATLGAMQVTQYVFPRFQDIIVTAKDAGLNENLLRLDANDFGPRLGVAWEVKKNLVVRAGYGMFYGLQQGNRIFSTTNANVPFVANEAASGNTTPVPTKNLGNYFAPISAQNYSLGPLAFFRPDPNMADPYFQQWNMSVQKALAGRIVVEAAYVGNKGTKLEFSRPINIPLPAAGVIQDRRPWTRFSSGTSIDNSGNSTYHALQSKVEVRMWRGLSLLAAYTWSKSIDDQSSDAQNSGVQDPNNLRAERGLSDFDLRHRFTASMVYALPMFANRRGFIGQALGGWQLSNIVTFQAGSPFTPAIGTDPANTGTSRRPNRVAEGTLPDRTIDRWYDVSAFKVPAAFTFGNSSRNILTGAPFRNWDFGLFKNFSFGALKEGMRLQFRGEAFNITNTAHFGGPTANVQAPAAGRILSAGAGRELQLALKLLF